MDTDAYKEVRRLFHTISSKYRVAHMTAYMFVTAMEAVVPLTPDYAKEHALITIQQMENRVGEKEFLELIKYLMGQCWTTSEEVRNASAREIRRLELSAPWAVIPSMDDASGGATGNNRNGTLRNHNTIASFSVNQELQRAVSDRDTVIEEQRRKILELEEQTRNNSIVVGGAASRMSPPSAAPPTPSMMTTVLPAHSSTRADDNNRQRSKQRRQREQQEHDQYNYEEELTMRGDDTTTYYSSSNNNSGAQRRGGGGGRLAAQYENAGDGDDDATPRPHRRQDKRKGTDDVTTTIARSPIDAKYEEASRKIKQVESSALFQHAVAQANMAQGDSMFSPVPTASTGGQQQQQHSNIVMSSRRSVVADARLLASASRVYERIGVTPPRVPSTATTSPFFPGGAEQNRNAAILSSSSTSPEGCGATMTTTATEGRRFDYEEGGRGGAPRSLFQTASGYGMHLQKQHSGTHPEPQQQRGFHGSAGDRPLLQVLPDPQSSLPHEYGSKLMVGPSSSTSSPFPSQHRVPYYNGSTPTDTLLPSAAMLTVEDVHRILTTPPPTATTRGRQQEQSPSTRYGNGIGGGFSDPTSDQYATLHNQQRMGSVYHMFQLEKNKTASSFAMNKPFNDGFLLAGNNDKNPPAQQ